jgi:hypothetical protein
MFPSLSVKYKSGRFARPSQIALILGNNVHDCTSVRWQMHRIVAVHNISKMLE